MIKLHITKATRFVVILDNLFENCCQPPRFLFGKFVGNFVLARVVAL